MDKPKKLFTLYSQAGLQGKDSSYDLLGQPRFLGRKGWTPNTDILETDESVLILIDLAGLEKDQIKIFSEGDIIKVAGLRLRPKIKGCQRFHRMEIEYGPFEKIFRIPSDLDVDQIKAEYKNGLLALTLPKKKGEDPIRLVITYED